MRKFNIALGAIVGVAVGTLLGVLLAPDKGTETRKKISTKTKETAGSIKDKFVNTIHGNGSKLKSQIEDKVN